MWGKMRVRGKGFASLSRRQEVIWALFFGARWTRDKGGCRSWEAGLGGGSEDDRGPGKSWASSHPDAPKGSHERRNEGQRRARGEEDTGRLKETVGVEVKKGRWDKH